MKSKRYLLILSLLIVALMFVGSVAASEDNNSTDDSLILEIDDESNNDILSVSQQDSSLSEAKTIVVDESGGTHNEMNEHAIRNAINSASDGDTIIVNGQSYEHVHVVIDKQLTIKSNI